MSASTTKRPPLGLPSGSVRALLTLLILAVVVAQLLRGQEVEVLWTETLMIALAHYFTSRRFINLAPEVIRQLESTGQLEQEAHPLYLPRHTIRILIFTVFVGVGVYLYRQDRLFDSQALSILGVVFAYVLGTVAHGILHWWTKGKQTPTVRGWEDLKAAAVLLVLLYTAATYLFEMPEAAPRQVRDTALALVLFYFGSR